MKIINQLSPLVIILWLAGCSSPLSQTTSSTEAPPSLRPLETTTYTSSPARLSLTFFRGSHEKPYDLYAVDITCLTKITMCFGEPKLIYKTILVKPEDTSKPREPILSYTWSPDGDKLALCAVGVDDDSDIFIGDMTTQEWVNLTNSSMKECNPQWSSDGKSICYVACSLDLYNNNRCRLYNSSLDGSEIRVLLRSVSDFHGPFSVSPDEQKVVFSLSDNYGYDQLFLADQDGSNLQQITSGSMNNLSPSFSPDGLHIVFDRTNRLNTIDTIQSADLIYMDLANGEEKNITASLDVEAYNPEFSPDGLWIAFNTKDLNSSSANIYVVSLNQTELIPVPTRSQNYDIGSIYYVDPSWRWVSAH